MKAKKVLITCLALVFAMTMFAMAACKTSAGTNSGSGNIVNSADSGQSSNGGNSAGGNSGNSATVTYTATFKVDGEVYYTFTGERNSVVEAPAEDPVKEGYTFVGWSGYSANYKLKSNKTFVAQFQKAMNGLPTATEFQTPDTATLPDEYEVNVYEAKKTTATIDIDGVLDDAYLEATPIEIAVKADQGGTVDATGFAYIIWDASYLYVYVTVNDTNVVSYTSGDRWLSDSVELVLDTWNKPSGKTQNYGDSYRGGDYQGEGQFRINPGESSVASGLHWMFDDGNVEKKGASRIIEGEGYTAEYKISWASFGSATAGKQVAFAILINDGVAGNRSGVTAIEAGHIDAFQWAGVLSKLNLVD